MILVHRISEGDTKYKEDISECLIHNATNPMISKIIIFSDAKDLDKKIRIDQSSKKVLLMKIGASHFDILKYAKKATKHYVIYSTPFIKFSDFASLNRLKEGEVIKDDYSYYIFNKNIKISDAKTIDEIILGKMVRLPVSVQKLGYYRTGVPVESIGWQINRQYFSKNGSATKKEEPKPTTDLKKIDLVKSLSPVVELKENKLVECPLESSRRKHRKIDVVIVSVNYNDFLILSLENNVKFFNRITVVTSPSDFMCQKICRKFGVRCVVTDRMYEDGAVFNKGKAINEGIKSLSDPDFVLLLDADVIVATKIEAGDLEDGVFYGSRRYMVPDYDCYRGYMDGSVSNENLIERPEEGIGFFQLFDTSVGLEYPESSDDASISDISFRDSFSIKKRLDLEVLHLGLDSNWKGRRSKEFLSYDQFDEILERSKKSTFKICTFYYNHKKESVREKNFLRFLEQFEGYEEHLLIGVVDYDGDLEIPDDLRPNIFKMYGDKKNPVWYKETILNRMIETIDTDYFIWMDCDLIYERLDWLDNIDSVVRGKDFVQLYKNIDYLGPDGKVIESHRSIMSSGRSDIDNLLGEGYKPGGAWIGKTSILRDKRFFEKMYVGGGDTIFIYALFGIKDGITLRLVKENNAYIWRSAVSWIDSFESYKIGHLDVDIRHLYHGDLKNRKYNDRYKKLKGIESRSKNCSILIPAFKAKDFLMQCIDSIVKQNTDKIKIEIIIGIDCCKETKEYVTSNYFLMNNCKVLYFDENSGPYLIRNTLIQLSKYENIIFFDADDIMCPGLIERTSEIMQQYDSVRWMFENFYEDIEDRKISPYHAHGVFAIRKSEIIRMNGFLPWRIGADSEFMERCRINRLSTFYDNDICFYRRQHDNNQTRNKITGLGSKKRIEVQKILKDMKKNNRFPNPENLNTKEYVICRKKYVII